jgi:hypothetical protein
MHAKERLLLAGQQMSRPHVCLFVHMYVPYVVTIFLNSVQAWFVCVFFDKATHAKAYPAAMLAEIV